MSQFSLGWRLFRGLLRTALQPVNFVKRSWSGSAAFDDSDRAAVRRLARRPSDISSHLERLYEVAVGEGGSTIVELGVRTGRSTAVFELAARRNGAHLVSVDIAPTRFRSSYERWQFVQCDDVDLGHRFEGWCHEHEVPYPANIIYLDTSHLYEHTVAELEAWLLHIAPGGVLLCHDTNMRLIYRRKDGTLGVGWNNERGVIRALEERFGFEIDENQPADLATGEWRVLHDPLGSGLTEIRRAG